MDRRSFLKRSAAGAAVAALPSGMAISSLMARPRSHVSAPATVRLGVASYSLRNFSRAEAIATIQSCGVHAVSIKSMHLPYEAGATEIATGIREFTDAGIEVVGGGVIYLKEDTDQAMRPLFDYAREAGFPLMVIGPTRESLPRVERFVQEYDIPVAIHNHGPEDEEFPAPSDALKVIRSMDPRIGVCVDVGHTTRTGNDVVDEIKAAGDRLFDVHMKDLSNLSEARSQCNVGEGAMPIPGIFSGIDGYELSRICQPGIRDQCRRPGAGNETVVCVHEGSPGGPDEVGASAARHLISVFL